MRNAGQSAEGNHKVVHVQLLGTDEKLKWTQMSAGLQVDLPRHYHPTVDYAAALKITPA